jgi:outer membrane biosynthesis protein TonB
MSTRRSLATAAVILSSGCAGKAHVVTPSTPATREGRSSFRVISEPAAQANRAEGQITIVPVAPGPENRLPVYPADALSAGCGRGAVAVRVHVGTLGRVVKQLPVPGHLTPTDLCQALFSRSVAETVERWGFFPALRQRCMPRKDSAPDCTSAPIESYVDFEFLFEVIDGRPTVHPR